MGISGEHLSGYEIAATLTEVLGKTVKYYPQDIETVRNYGWTGADILANTFQFYGDFQDHFLSLLDIKESKKLDPELMTFKEWAIAHKEALSST